jgi:predicted Fe-S protein YdhL (DUF1289 family)
LVRAEMYITPCISLCVIDIETQICKGCQRTSVEIQEWAQYTYNERMVIMRRTGYGTRGSRRDESREEKLRRYDRG